jgi:hypothetical protein
VAAYNLFLFKVPEQTQIKALKYVSCVRRESDHFHPVICEHLHCLRLYMNGKIVQEQSSFFICEFFIRPSFVDVWKVSESIDRRFQICSQGNAVWRESLKLNGSEWVSI